MVREMERKRERRTEKEEGKDGECELGENGLARTAISGMGQKREGWMNGRSKVESATSYHYLCVLSLSNKLDLSTILSRALYRECTCLLSV